LERPSIVAAGLAAAGEVATTPVEATITRTKGAILLSTASLNNETIRIVAQIPVADCIEVAK
jgi:hypothetical protein